MVSKDRNTDARRAVLREWDNWAKSHQDANTSTDAMLFFSYLRKEKPELLDFRFPGDKWQTINGWLLSGGRVKN